MRPLKTLSEAEKKKRRKEQKKMAMRRLRERQRKNPEALEERRQKDREYYRKKKAENKIKSISDYTPREQRVMRRIWRDKARNYRAKQKELKKALAVIATPPSSPRSSVSGASTSQALIGKKKAATNRRRLVTENAYLKKRLRTLEFKLNNYRSKLRRCEKPKKEEKSEQKQADKVKQKQITEKLKTKVRKFLEEDCNSRLTAGKKETITRKRVKKQIRLLSDTLLNLHQKFKEKTGSKISYSLFCKYRPFWVVVPTEKSRNTCLCATHTNTNNLVRALKQSKMVNLSTPIALAKTICCNENMRLNEICLERRCQSCYQKELSFNAYNDNDMISYEKWITKRVCVTVRGKEKVCHKSVRETVHLNKKDAADLIKVQIIPFMQHQANINHQYAEITHIKTNLTVEEALLHIDYSENYNCKYGEEIQSAHFGGSKPQICLHTSVLYYRDIISNSIKSESICTLSENLRHDPVLVCAHLHPVFERLKTVVPNLKTFNILSDGATTQYRNKNMFHLIMNYICPLLAVREFFWHYSEKGHGKGAPDGVGGCVKRIADRGAALGKDVNNFETLINYLKENCKKIAIIPIDDSLIDNIQKCLENGTILPFKGTLKIHQIAWSSKNSLTARARRLSCSKCSVTECCVHYELGFINIMNQNILDETSLKITPRRRRHPIMRRISLHHSDSDSDDNNNPVISTKDAVNQPNQGLNINCPLFAVHAKNISTGSDKENDETLIAKSINVDNTAAEVIQQNRLLPKKHLMDVDPDDDYTSTGSNNEDEVEAEDTHPILPLNSKRSLIAAATSDMDNTSIENVDDDEDNGCLIDVAQMYAKRKQMYKEVYSSESEESGQIRDDINATEYEVEDIFDYDKNVPYN